MPPRTLPFPLHALWFTPECVLCSDSTLCLYRLVFRCIWLCFSGRREVWGRGAGVVVVFESLLHAWLHILCFRRKSTGPCFVFFLFSVSCLRARPSYSRCTLRPFRPFSSYRFSFVNCKCNVSFLLYFFCVFVFSLPTAWLCWFLCHAFWRKIRRRNTQDRLLIDTEKKNQEIGVEAVFLNCLFFGVCLLRQRYGVSVERAMLVLFRPPPLFFSLVSTFLPFFLRKGTPGRNGKSRWDLEPLIAVGVRVWVVFILDAQFFVLTAYSFGLSADLRKCTRTFVRRWLYLYSCVALFFGKVVVGLGKGRLGEDMPPRLPLDSARLRCFCHHLFVWFFLARVFGEITRGFFFAIAVAWGRRW